ncbi:MAG: hypothetical protein ABIQ86_16405 [Steroidobacteraceae bacterium]
MNKATWLARKSASPAAPDHTLLALCVLTVAIRLVTTWLLPSVAQADETFQYLEQANRLISGRGMIPWEYEIGVRSWIIPGFLAGLFRVATWISPDPAARLWSATFFMCALSCVTTMAGYRLSQNAGAGRIGALFAGLLLAVWSELVYFSAHVLADSISAATLVMALATCYPNRNLTSGRLILAGALFGLTLVIRIQLAPAIAIAMIWLCFGKARARVFPLCAGFVLPVAVLAIVDWMTWGVPMISLWKYVQANGGGLAAVFGIKPGYYYFGKQLLVWHVATPLILTTAVIGARRAPLLAVIGIAIVVTFSLVGHKELRFIFPALPLCFILSGIGTADAIEWLRRRQKWETTAARSWLIAGAAITWVAASIAVSVGFHMRTFWTLDADPLAAMRIINADRSSCGVGLAQPKFWWATGLVRLRNDLQIYNADSTHIGNSAAAYNYVMDFSKTSSPTQYEALGFKEVQCFSHYPLCLYRRRGACDPASGEPSKAVHPDGLDEVLRKLKLLPSRSEQ